ncbi:hypothetical protein G3O08_20190 [Cryomorpha ignava]|uniref:RHS repeat-associated core domain-containing protein n=1 Tax=Cryomorpha ignava TaxID=101383 RepID=A0A7K3WW02_9FLAO|nr:RHS repeat-associated core domain-containing protein [Cryomorpha ignava]NEN25813.1 hypothetical protein [Cryomorpha ignava]
MSILKPAYDSSDNKLKSFTVNSTTYGSNYDPYCSLTKEGQSRYYEWGANDKLAVFKNQAGSSTPFVYTNYFYNAQGDRIKKHTRKGNKIVVTFYPCPERSRRVDGGMFETTYTKTVGGSIDNNRFFNTIKISDDGALIATIRVGNNVDDDTPAIKYIVGDHLNNSTAVLKTTGTLINREEYYPFGETSFGGFQYKRYRYNGKEKDEESGLYEYGQRYYAPWLCRFVSVDPIAEDYPFYSSYNYAGNKPISKVDIDGLQEEGAPKFDSGNKDFDKVANQAINDAGAENVDIQIHSIDGIIEGRITTNSATAFFDNNGFFSLTENGERQSLEVQDDGRLFPGGISAGIGQIGEGLGRDLELRKELYIDNYKADLETFKENPNQAVFNRQNNLGIVREKSSPLGRALAEKQKPFNESVRTTEKILAGKKDLGRTNVRVDKFTAYRKVIRGAGWAGIVLDLYFAADRIKKAENKPEAIMSEAMGLSGAFMLGATFAMYGAVLGPVGALIGGIVGATLGYYLASGEASKDISHMQEGFQSPGGDNPMLFKL